ncbi:MAG TPA: YkvA family protein [candidate division Zixibacteria bacterium]|nr:YkvA family protein [candidate division Zixibacteria bacterium]
MKYSFTGLTARLRKRVHALYLAARDPRVPWTSKLVIGVVVAYALSPIDLIPDFIPVIGYIDDIIILPIGIWLAVKLIPRHVWQDCLDRAAMLQDDLPRNRRAAVVVVLVWIIVGLVLGLWIYGLVKGGRSEFR